MKFIMKWTMAIWLCLYGYASPLAATTGADSVLSDSAVILMYHHVSADTPAITSVTPDVFAEHIEYVHSHFNVVSLGDLLAALQTNQPLAPNSLAITFDDGYRNILDNGHPVLSRLNLPYTVFINPNRIGQESSQLTWQEVRELAAQGVSFANHTLDHLHLLNRKAAENEQLWLARIWQNVLTAQQKIEQELGDTPRWLAYPFGEFNAAIKAQALKDGFIGLGQHSGAVSSSSDFGALPRFPAAGIYSAMRTLKTKMHSLAMPIIETYPADPERPRGETIRFGFQFNTGDVVSNQLRCYYNGAVIPHVLTDNKVSIDSTIPLPTGRSRVNCTAPSRSQSGRFYWYSQPFFVANEQGVYPD